MALKGSLDDFNIVNILQMIKLEGKTGRLTITDADKLVKITFDQGNIIYAEADPLRDEARIESCLLSNSFITPQQWVEVRKEHDDKLKPYWEILAKKLNSQALLELINRQVIDNVYYALRWKKGTYEFSPIKSLKYNQKVMRPMDVDGLLMEGCRIADEWSRITASMPPLDTFIEKNILGEGEEDDSLNVSGQPSEQAGDYRSSLEYEILTSRGINISDKEVAVLSITGGGKTIRELMDSARQGHFDTLDAIHSLLQSAVLKTTAKKKKTMVSLDHTGYTTQLVTVAILIALFAGGIYWQLTMMPKSFEIQKAGDIKVKRAQVVADLKKIERGMKTYLALTRKLPDKLQTLVDSGVLLSGELIDPWLHGYQLEYTKNKKRFSLYSRGPDEVLTTDNIYLR